MNSKRDTVPDSTRGLINRPGENNCFVNSVIQLLWHSDAFRRNFLRINFHTTCDEIVRMEEEAKATEVPVLAGPVELQVSQLEPVEEEAEKVKKEEGEAPTITEETIEEPVVQAVEAPKVTKRCMVCALQNLFIMFRYSDEPTIPPTIVRKVMSDVFEEGQMHSALDCLEFVLRRLSEKKLYSLKEETLLKVEKLLFNGNETKLNLPNENEKIEFLKNLEKRKIDLIQTVFSHSFCEIRRCNCYATSEPFISKTIFLHLSVNNLVQINTSEINKIKDKNPLYSLFDIKRNFSEIIHKSLTTGHFDCPEHGKECKFNGVELENTLLEIPKTFCLTFNWVSEFSSKGIISNLLDIIQEELNLTKLFKFYPEINSKDKSDYKYQLNGAIAYYGKHYTVYVFNSKQKQWIYCDDHKIKIIGNFKKVLVHASKNKHQIELLIYGSTKPDFIKR